MDPRCGGGVSNWQALVSVAPRNGRHQSPAVKRIRDGLVHDARATRGTIRWAAPFAAILSRFISPNGIRRAAACNRKPAANPSHADFGPIFLIMHEIQPDRRTFAPATELRRHILAWRHYGPLATSRLQQTWCLRRKLGRVVEIGVISPVACWRAINVCLAPKIGGVEAREHLDHRTNIGEYDGRSPGFKKT